jgi:hypothetical protein
MGYDECPLAPCCTGAARHEGKSIMSGTDFGEFFREEKARIEEAQWVKKEETARAEAAKQQREEDLIAPVVEVVQHVLKRAAEQLKSEGVEIEVFRAVSSKSGGQRAIGFQLTQKGSHAPRNYSRVYEIYVNVNKTVSAAVTDPRHAAEGELLQEYKPHEFVSDRVDELVILALKELLEQVKSRS